jgi:hypothetical protein
MASHHFTVRLISILWFTMLLASLCAAQAIPVSQRIKPPAAGARAAASNAVSVSPGGWSQLAKFVPTNGCCLGLENNSVAISGDTVVIGQEPLGSGVKIVAQVFTRATQGWRNSPPVAKLSGPAPTEPYMAPVAIDGDTIVAVGPIGFQGMPGYAFVYVKPPGGWTDMSPTAVLSPSDDSKGTFGQAVAISGDTVVISDDGDTTSTPGEAYVFVKPAGGWHNMTETAKLTPSDGAMGDRFGWSVSISGATIVIGAPQDGDISSPGPGKAYVFVEPVTGWHTMTQSAELTVSNSTENEEIGLSVSVNGNTVLTGAPGYQNFQGAAFVFEKPAAGWKDMTQTATLTPVDGASGGFFGWSVGISGKIAAVGSPGRGVAPNGFSGGVYIFEEPAGGWQNAASSIVLTGADAHFNVAFGNSLGISGKTLVGGTQRKSALGTSYVFGLP